MRVLAVGLILIGSAFGQHRMAMAGGGFGHAGGAAVRGGFHHGGPGGAFRGGGFGHSFHPYYRLPRYYAPLYLPFYASSYWPSAFNSDFDYGYYNSDANGYSGQYSYGATPSVVIINSTTAAPSPEVVYQQPPTYQPRVYQQDPAPARENRQLTYLIGMKDGTTRAAAAYWITGNTLHFVTSRDRQVDDVPFDQLDRAFTDRLNKAQNVVFHLPPARAQDTMAEQPRRSKPLPRTPCADRITPKYRD